MKRPEGFDPQNLGTPAEPARGAEPRKRKTRPQAVKPGAAAAPKAAARASKPREPREKKAKAAAESAAVEARPQRRPREKEAPGTDSSRQSNAQARKAARVRRRYERSEVRRFTRRSRHRRFAWLTAALAFVALCVLVTVAVYSPLLALKTLRIEGASRVSAGEIRTALKDQVGTPLALVDFGEIKKELAKFPLIRSYVTEAVPPNTLVVHIVERSPLGVIVEGSSFVVVDAAGVTISHETERPAKLPIIDSGSTKTTSAAFKAAVAVLLALPDSVSSRVDTVSARTKDDVTLVLDGVGQRVVWGSPDRSGFKARVLADLISHQNPNAVVEYDVSAPNSAVVRTG